ncbi:MAG: hypothetical protein WDM81_03460 [Rhizomicrobium sp.]
MKSSRIWPEQLSLLAQRGQIFDADDPSQAGQGLSGRADRRRQSKRPGKGRSELEIVHQFEPVWDAKNEVISTYLCTPESIECRDAPGEMVTMAELTQNERAMAELSCLRIRRRPAQPQPGIRRPLPARRSDLVRDAVHAERAHGVQPHLPRPARNLSALYHVPAHRPAGGGDPVAHDRPGDDHAALRARHRQRLGQLPQFQRL